MTVSDAAVALANAIEVVMNSLPGLVLPKASEELRWPVCGRRGDGDLIFDVFCCKTGDRSRRLSFDTVQQHGRAEGK